jgi:hypothetical protein
MTPGRSRPVIAEQRLQPTGFAAPEREKGTFETGTPPDWEQLPAEAARDSTVGPAPVQVLPNGPDARVDAIDYVLLSAAFVARQELFREDAARLFGPVL